MRPPHLNGFAVLCCNTPKRYNASHRVDQIDLLAEDYVVITKRGAILVLVRPFVTGGLTMLAGFEGRYHPLQDYGVIGDCRSVALVGPDGSIDFMCLPRFDSPSVFAALLDADKGGRFRITPQVSNTRQKKIYLPNTNILITRFNLNPGVAELTDFMVIGAPGDPNVIVRRIKSIKGEFPCELVMSPRFGYAAGHHTVTETSDGVIFQEQEGEKLALRLRSSAKLEVRGGEVVSEFTLAAGESVWATLEVLVPGRESITGAPDFISESFKATTNFWYSWVGRSSYRGRWREMVNRSALTLKLLTSQDFGSMVAAPTFGLPEHIGGPRNWDYRYTWIRDSSFSVYALMRLGFVEEAGRFMSWVGERLGDGSGSPPLQIMYGIDGRSMLTEFDLDHLEGYCASKPVRVGNGAYDQLQLDIYGELMDSLYLYDKYGSTISYDLWQGVRTMLSWLAKNWRREDEGIWEVRGGRKQFLLSRVMAWVAFDRAIRLANKRSYPAPIVEWTIVRDEIYHSVFTEMWSKKRSAFVQSLGSEAMDASALIMPLVRFISPVDPRWISTLRAIETDLVDDSLVFRYRPDVAAPDGLEGEEGTFSMCSFWYIEALGRSGDLEQARFFFEKMLTHANRLGLYGEEIGSSGEALGNFPQAFTHLALISTAFDLDRRLDAAGITI